MFGHGTVRAGDTSTIWVAAMESGRVRILELGQSDDVLREVRVLNAPEDGVPPAASQGEPDPRSDVMGAGPEDDVLGLARVLDDHLVAALEQGAFGRLIMIAPGSALPFLVARLSPPVRACLIAEMEGDRAEHSAAALRSILPV